MTKTDYGVAPPGNEGFAQIGRGIQMYSRLVTDASPTNSGFI